MTPNKKFMATLALCALVFIGFTFTAGCQKAEEKEETQAPAVTPAPAPEVKEAEEGKPAETGEVTVMGKVNEQGDIVAEDGKEYVVTDENMRKELMGKVDTKVKVTGTVEEREGKMLIKATSYEVIEE